MRDFLRTRLLPWTVWAAAMGTAGWLSLGQSRGSATGFVESVAYEAIAPQTARVASVLVEVGDSVRGGEVIATLDTSELRAELELLDAERRRIRAELGAVDSSTRADLSETQRDIEESVDAAERAHQAAVSLRSVSAAELTALGGQIEHMRELVEKRMADRRDLSELEVSQTVLRKKVQQADTTIRQLQRQAVSARGRRGAVSSGDASTQATGPLRAELAVLDLREKLSRARIETLTMRAPADGEITAVHLRAGEIATVGATVATIAGLVDAFRDHAPAIRLCVPESQASSVEVYEAVALHPVDTHAQSLTGHVTHLAATVSQFPERCWPDPRVPQWGVTVWVTPDEATTIRPGQSFTADFLGHRSEHATEQTDAPPEVRAAAPAMPTVVAPTPAAAAPVGPIDVVISAALSGRSRIEPSGALWVAALERYVVVSDDTGWPKSDEHAPWLFTMDRLGRFDDAPLVIHGLEEVRDLEAIAPAPDGGFYVLSSQGLSRKRKRAVSRQHFAHVTLVDGRATAASHIALAQALDAASKKTRASLGLRGTAQLEIEGLTATSEGGLLIGLKAPLSDSGAALIWHLPDPDALLRGDGVEAAGLTLWGEVPVRVLADGKPVPGGIAELLELPDHTLLVAATVSGRSDPKTQDGVIVRVSSQDTLANGRVIATFPGLKPEGLARSADGNSFVVFFDTGANQTPRWVEQPWPAA